MTRPLGADADGEADADAASGARGLWIGLALGAPVMAYGIGGTLADAELTRPAELARWIVGLALVHDLVVVPLALAVGWGLRRVVPARPWRVVRWALMASAVLVLLSWPFVRGYGLSPTVPSLLPRDYGAGLGAYLAVVWVLAAVAVGAGRLAARRRGATAARAGGD